MSTAHLIFSVCAAKNRAFVLPLLVGGVSVRIWRATVQERGERWKAWRYSWAVMGEERVPGGGGVGDGEKTVWIAVSRSLALKLVVEVITLDWAEIAERG